MTIVCSQERDRGSHFYLGLGWWHHSGIKKHDIDLRFQKGTRSIISHGRQREITLVSGCKIQTRRGQIHSRQRTLHRNDAWAVSNGSMQTLKNTSWFEFETSDSTERRRRSGPEDLQKLGWTTSVSGRTDETRHHIHSQHSVHSDHSHHSVDTWMHQSTLNVRKKTSEISSRFKRLQLTYKKEASCDWVGKVMHTGLVTWTTDNQRRATTSCSMDLAQHSAGVSRSRPQLLFFIRSRISGHGSSSSRSIVSEATSGEFRHPTETSNSNWRGQPELH